MPVRNNSRSKIVEVVTTNWISRKRAGYMVNLTDQSKRSMFYANNSTMVVGYFHIVGDGPAYGRCL